jgi:hypothetical protein
MSPVWDFARVLLPRSSMDGALAMLTAYFDDTGAHDESPLVGFAGLIGAEVQWSAFEAAWCSKLRAPLARKPPLSRFHMTDCMTRRNEFLGYSNAERDAIAHDFREIIIASGVAGYAIVASCADWNELVLPSQASLLWQDAEAFCFRDCVSKMCLFIEQFSPSDRELSLVFDNMPHRLTINQRIYQEYQNYPPTVGANLLGVSFLNSTSFVPLQGADIFAWEFFAHCRELLKADGGMAEPRPHARQFFDTGRFHMNLVDRAICEKIAGISAASSQG